MRTTIDTGPDTISGEDFECWLGQDGRSFLPGKEFAVNGHYDFYLKEHNHYWLVFDANAGGPGSGATYTPPQLIFGEGVTTTEPAEPSRPGYKFLGWNTETDGTGDWWGTYYTISAEGEKIPHEGTQQFGSVLEDDVNLYAQWEGDETSYYIIFWKQKADATGTDKENDYDYAESVVRTAKTGETVSLINADRQKGGTGNSDYGYFFTFNGNNSDVTATVNANGDTHLNVYYDRREITYVFKYAENKTISGYDLAKIGDDYAIKINGKWHEITAYGYFVWNNAYSITSVSNNKIKYKTSLYSSQTYTTEYDNSVYSIKEDESYTGLYGSAFTQWPDAGSGKTWNDGQYSYPLAITVFDPAVTGTTNPEGTTISFSIEDYDSSDNNRLYVYQQKVDGSWGYTSDDYLCPPADLGSGGVWRPTETFTGFTVSGYQVGDSLNTSESEWNVINNTNDPIYYGWVDHGMYYSNWINHGSNLYLRYSRNQYKITYVSEGEGADGRQEHSEEGIYYDTVLTGFDNKYIPTNGRDGYAFVGWYADKDCQIPFDFTGRMGASDVTVYAKWETQRARVVLIPNAPEGQYSFANNQNLSFRLNYNEKVDGKNITGTAVKRTGYTLAGWYVTVDGQDYLWNFDTPVNNTVKGVNKDYQKTEDWKMKW